MAWTKEELKHQGNKEINIDLHRMNAASLKNNGSVKYETTHNL